MKMLNGDTTALTPSAPSSAPDVLRLSLFKPPDERTDQRGIMVMQKGSQPVEILMSVHFTP